MNKPITKFENEPQSAGVKDQFQKDRPSKKVVAMFLS